MPFKLYAGLPRSGKSYSAVKDEVVPAMARGRRVVTNVSGINQDAIIEFLMRDRKAFFGIIKRRGIKREKIGELVHVTNDQVAASDFFPNRDDPFGATVKPGDLVIIDECWEYWPAKHGSELKRDLAKDREFFRLHGHFVHPKTKRCIDVILMTQDFKDMHPDLDAIIQNTYYIENLRHLGFPSRFRTDVFRKTPRYRSTPFKQIPGKYDPEIFKLYKSFSMSEDGSGEVKDTNDKSSFFKSGFWLVGLPVILGLMIWSGFGIWNFFHPKPKDGAPVAKHVAPGAPVSPVGSGAGASVSAPAVSEYRAVGWYRADGNQFVLIRDDKGSDRTLINPRNWFLDRIRYSGSLDGRKIAEWTGSPPAPEKKVVLP